MLLRIARVAIEETLRLLHPPVLLHFVSKSFFKLFFYFHVTAFQFSNKFSLNISLFSYFIPSINPTHITYSLHGAQSFLSS